MSTRRYVADIPVEDGDEPISDRLREILQSYDVEVEETDGWVLYWLPEGTTVSTSEEYVMALIDTPKGNFILPKEYIRVARDGQ